MARRLGSDRSLGETWERYHLIRACLRQPGEQRALTAIRLDYERAPSRAAAEESRSAGHQSQARWLRPLGGAAIAASVAAVAVMLAVGYSPAPDPATPGATQPFASPNPPGVLPLSQPVSSPQRMNTYLLRHNQAAGQVGRQGFVSQMPLISATPVQVIEPASPVPPAEEAGEQAQAGSESGGTDSP
jgi:hypothetical protein